MRDIAYTIVNAQLATINILGMLGAPPPRYTASRHRDSPSTAIALASHMTEDDPLATYRRDGESPQQTLARLSAVVARAREEEVVIALSGIDSGSSILASAIRVFGTSTAACEWLSVERSA